MWKMITASALIGLSALTVSTPEPMDAAKAGSYKIDPGHSSVIFSIKHMGIANFYGRFNKVAGSIDVADDMSKSKITITIDAESVDSNSEGRDKHIRSADFLNAKQFPDITFTSTGVLPKSGETMTVKGDLTMHGVTQEIEAEVTFTGAADARGYKAGWEARFTVQRSKFGMTGLLQGVSDEIAIIAAVEAAKQ